jgi:hypothetical protein
VQDLLDFYRQSLIEEREEQQLFADVACVCLCVCVCVCVCVCACCARRHENTGQQALQNK